ncbi:MAG: hypothetical protein K8R90_02100 [Candidatus Cloacimonetes bacterium]|nr:hypothetical protein [Candidatus Cloacimonadota bacterium]
MTYFDRAMIEYYRVLNNAWKKEVKQAARQAIRALSDIPRHHRLDSGHIDDILAVIDSNLGEDFAALVRDDTKAYVQRCLLLGLGDAQKQVPHNTSIGLYGIRERKLETLIARQNMFWIGERYNADIADKFKTTLTEAVSAGYTKKMLQQKLAEQFKDLGEKSHHYWQGLAEHTALRIREFGRLEGYRKAGAKGYRLVVVLDERTSDICRALAAEGKVYPLADALDTMNQLLDIDTRQHSLESVREMTKEIAPWVSDKQVVRNASGEPIGVSGSHTPFPPFHWRCRTGTEVVE